DGPQPDQERRLIRLINVQKRPPNSREEMVLARAGGRQAKQVLELIKHQQDRSTEREPDDYGVRNIFRQIAESQQRDAGLDRADDEGEENDSRDSLGIAESN